MSAIGLSLEVVCSLRSSLRLEDLDAEVANVLHLVERVRHALEGEGILRTDIKKVETLIALVCHARIFHRFQAKRITAFKASTVTGDRSFAH